MISRKTKVAKKFPSFHTAQCIVISREIKIGGSRISKNAVLTILEAVHFVDFIDFSNIGFQSSKSPKIHEN